MYSSNAASYRRLPVKSSMSVYDFDNQVFPAHINRNLTQLPDGPLTIVSPHNHEELEILCIRSGRAEAALNGQRTWLFKRNECARKKAQRRSRYPFCGIDIRNVHEEIWRFSSVREEE